MMTHPTLPVRSQPVIAYMMSRFPKITETFILYEVLELERRGVTVEVFPLLRERAAVLHPEAERLMPRVRFLPFLSASILVANLTWLLRAPLLYLGALTEVLRGTRGSLNFMVGALGIFPKTAKFAADMKILGITHVHAHFANHPALAALIIHRLTGIPFSFTAHGSDIHIDQTMFDRKIAAAVFAVTVARYNVDFLAAAVGVGVRDKLRVIRCGIDTAVFRPSDRRRSPDAPFSILCVAALREVKGHRHLLDACAILARRGIRFVCDIVGEGPLRAVLDRQVRDLGISDSVVFHGAKARPAVVAMMQAADAVVLPSIVGSRGDREGVPVVLMEAMACAVPVVSTRQSGIPELVEDGVSGLLCPAGDADCLAAALARLATDPEWCQRLGEAGRRKVLAEYDLRRNVADLADLLTGAATAAGDGE